MRFRTRDIEFSPIKRIQAEAEKLGAVSLAQGIPKFLPPLGIRRVVSEAIEQGKADFYGPPQGIEALRKEIAVRHLAEESASYNHGSEVLVTAGALQGIVAALLAFLSPGDELLIPSPTYFPFLNLPEVLSVKPVLVPLRGDGWRLSVSALKEAITPKTAGILLVHPNNPTGTVYTKEELEGILKLAEEHNLLIFVDEVYRYFVYPPSSGASTSVKASADRSEGQVPAKYTSLGKFKQYRDRVIRAMSFSKAFSLSGWRVGYLLADKRLTTEILKVHEMMTTASASLPAQYAALAALSDFPNLPREFAGVLERRRERMGERLGKLSSFFEFRDPVGAYYFFAKILNGPLGGARDRQDDRVFCEKLLKEAGVALVPGSTFGEEGRGFVRLSFAAKEGEIDEAFDRLERYLLGGKLGPVPIKDILKEAKGVSDDSRAIKPGQVFVAVSGAEHDGHNFIPEALKKGASFVVGERDLSTSEVFEDLTSEVGYVRVDNSRKALGILSAAWQSNPSEKLKVIGVTGTDGKTTTSHLLNSVLKEIGLRSSILSTLNAPGAHTTTPSAPVLQEWLAREVEKGTKMAILEATSHGIAQERIAGIKFTGAVLTNITPEHLDYHETFARYRDTKARLFRNAKFSVLNRDDRSFARLAKIAGGRIISYGFSQPKADGPRAHPQAEFRATDVKIGRDGCRFKLVRENEELLVKFPLPGEYNILNALAAASSAWGLTGADLSIIKRGLENFDSSLLAGRFEGVKRISDFTVVIDFAHTPNALAKVLNYVARVKPTNSRLLVVFGCAGERDELKRSAMGRIAARTADFVVLTSEDPRSEDPEKIIDEIACGCFAEGAVEGKNFVRISDRRSAISFALKRARKDDYLLVLGKGHEPTMAIGGVEYPWSDREVIKEEWRGLKPCKP